MFAATARRPYRRGLMSSPKVPGRRLEDVEDWDPADQEAGAAAAT
jgi:hypothetical protein